jgi:hypothetical protein
MSGAILAPDRWHRIEELFYASIDMPVKQRAAFLHETCGSDSDLRLDVESLVAADAQEDPLICGIIDDATAGLFEYDSATHSNRTGEDA